MTGGEAGLRALAYQTAMPGNLGMEDRDRRGRPGRRGVTFFESEVGPVAYSLTRGPLAAPSFARLEAFVVHERAEWEVYPPPGDVFTALRLAHHGWGTVVARCVWFD